MCTRYNYCNSSKMSVRTRTKEGKGIRPARTPRGREKWREVGNQGRKNTEGKGSKSGAQELEEKRGKQGALQRGEGERRKSSVQEQRFERRDSGLREHQGERNLGAWEHEGERGKSGAWKQRFQKRNSGARQHQREGKLGRTRTGEEKFGGDLPVVATNNPCWLLRDQLNEIS